MEMEEEGGPAAFEDATETPAADGEEEEDLGAREPKGRRAPRGPTDWEHAEHNLTHLPYRSWCLPCVAGRGRGPEHTTEEEKAEEPKPLKVCLDFWYPARGPSKKKEEEQRANEEEEEKEE